MEYLLDGMTLLWVVVAGVLYALIREVFHRG
jgi:hypothetical protein